jgi:heat shock protein HslJ
MINEKKVKSGCLWLVILLLAVFIYSACAGTPQPQVPDTAPEAVPMVSGEDLGKNFFETKIIDKDWYLDEVNKAAEKIIIDRNKLASEGFKDVFTLRFDDERIGGTGAPNRYFAPYSLGEENTIVIKTIAGTLMAPIREPEKLKELEFYNLLQNVHEWNLAGEKLELFSKNENGIESVWVFTLHAK